MLVFVSFVTLVAGCSGGTTQVTTNTRRLIHLPDGRAIKELGWRVNTSMAKPVRHGLSYGYVTNLDLSSITFANPDRNVPAGVTAEGLDLWKNRVRKLAERNDASVASISANTESIMYEFRFRRDRSGFWKRVPSSIFIHKNVGFHIHL